MENRKGSQIPTFRWCLDYERTEGIYAAQLSAAYDLSPHEWQELILNDWLAVDENGILLNNFCALEVPRQNGKTGVSDPRETWGLIQRAESILHTAQEYQTAKKAFDRLRAKFGDKANDPFAKYPELNAMVKRYTTSANQMILDLTNGGHIEFRTRGSGSDMGRGGTFDLVVIDEAQSYTQAQAEALSPLNSAAPSGSPQTILMGTPPTPEALHKGFIFAKAIAEIKADKPKGSCVHEWGVNEVGDVRDKNRWYATNPSLGYQLLESALEKDLRTMTDDGFAREHLGHMTYVTEKKQDFAINYKMWQACKSPRPKPEGKTAYGVKFSADGSKVTLCGAVIDSSGLARISLIEEKETIYGTGWLADWLNARYKTASCVVIDGKNGVDVLVDKIASTWRLKGTIIRPSAGEMIAAVSTLTNEISEKTVTWYELQEQLDDSAKTSVKRAIGKGWGFGGDNSGPIEACALALWGCRNSKREPGKQMRIG